MIQIEKIIKQNVPYIVVEEKENHYVVNRLEIPSTIGENVYYLSNRETTILKDDEYDISEFDENLLS